MNDGLNIVREPGAELNAGTFIYEILYFQIAKKYAYKRVQQMFVHRRKKKTIQRRVDKP